MEFEVMRVGIEVGGTFTDLVMSDGKNIKTANKETRKKVNVGTILKSY